MREFDLGDVLSITTGRLVSSRHIEGVYDILNYMTGDNLMTHQLPRAERECQPRLLEQHPQLANVDASGVNRENHSEWLAEQKLIFGDALPVAPLSPEDHTYVHPLDEANLKGKTAIPIIVDRTDT